MDSVNNLRFMDGFSSKFVKALPIQLLLVARRLIPPQREPFVSIFMKPREVRTFTECHTANQQD